MSVLTTLERYLPPPRYLEMPFVGVDISDTSLKYIQFGRRHEGKRALELWGEVDIPAGVLDRGQVHDVKQS
jgi:Tfp pilus assembly PilM family ATPase